MNPSPAGATLVLDVFSLDGAQKFWGELLGYAEVARDKDGTLVEARRLVSTEAPSVELLLRRCDPRPPVGCAVGSIRGIEFHVENPAANAARVADPVWVQSPEGDDPPRVSLRDPSGYIVTLVRSPDGSACTPGSP